MAAPAISQPELLSRLAQQGMSRRSAGRVLRVRIDGPDAAGKTMLADALASTLAARAGGAARRLRHHPG